jgi:hypothetical protein
MAEGLRRRIRYRASYAALAIALLPFGAQAAGLPADCSSATIPSGSAKGSIAGVAFVPSDVSVSLGDSAIGNGHTYDSYAFMFEGRDKSDEEMSLSLTIIVAKGAAPDGKKFRLLATDDDGKQPHAGPGAPEVQGWSLEYAAKGVDVDFISTTASLRLEIDQLKDKKLAGRIYFCVPSASNSSLAGSFSADLQ